MSAARAAALRAQADALVAQARALRDEADAVETEAAVGTRVPTAPEPVYMRVAAYAERVSMSERSIWSLVGKGLPTVGQGRGRRVDVARADGWIREQRGSVDDLIERSARAAARAAAKRAGDGNGRADS